MSDPRLDFLYLPVVNSPQIQFSPEIEAQAELRRNRYFSNLGSGSGSCPVRASGGDSGSGAGRGPESGGGSGSGSADVKADPPRQAFR